VVPSKLIVTYHSHTGKQLVSNQLQGVSEPDPNLLLVTNYIFWDSQSPLAPWRAASNGVVSSKQIVTELGLGSFLVVSYVFLG